MLPGLTLSLVCRHHSNPGVLRYEMKWHLLFMSIDPEVVVKQIFCSLTLSRRYVPFMQTGCHQKFCEFHRPDRPRRQRHRYFFSEKVAWKDVGMVHLEIFGLWLLTFPQVLSLFLPQQAFPRPLWNPTHARPCSNG